MSKTPTHLTSQHTPDETTNNTPSSAETTEEATTDETVCPECGGEVLADKTHGERICETCGLVVDEDGIDRGPEWRAFSHQERQDRSRVGSPTTNLQHDKGLSTNISWQNKDARGQSLSSKQRAKMQRLRKWNERFRTQNSRQRAQKQANNEIQRMGSALGIPKDAQETAAMLYERASEAETVIGRSIEGVATACLYGAARMHGTPRPLDQLVPVSRVERLHIARCFTQLKQDLNLSFEPVNPKEYVPQIINDIPSTLPARAEKIARELSEAAFHSTVGSGKKPTVVAGAAIYAASLIIGKKITQREVADAADITAVSIRNLYQELIGLRDDHENKTDSSTSSTLTTQRSKPTETSKEPASKPTESNSSTNASQPNANTSSESLECPECGDSDFKNKRGRNIHISRVHGSEQIPTSEENTNTASNVNFDHELACPKCGRYDFEGKNGRNKHIGIMHGSEHIPDEN